MTASAQQPPQGAFPVHHGQDQTDLAPSDLLHSGNAGMIIYRTGQLAYEYAAEGRGFSVDLLRYINKNHVGVATTFCYEETFGVRDRLHWLIHMRSPNEYQKLLHMVDHDDEFQGISAVDRLPEKGHGNWERIFVDGSMKERILVPQHGLEHAHDEDSTEGLGEEGNFMPSARHQTSQPFDVQLNSANAGALVMRTSHVKYEFREEGRLFAFDWQEQANRALSGAVTVLLYEETFGRQDRIYSLIHLRELSDYWRLAEWDRSPEAQRLVYDKQRVHDSKGGGTWSKVFVQDSIRDTLLLPQPPLAGSGGR